MLISELEKGHDATLFVYLEEKTAYFQTKIVEIAPDFVLIEPILHNGMTVGFKEGCSVDFQYVINPKVYTWKSVNVSLIRWKEQIFHKVDLYGAGQPLNRRQSFRLYLGEEMSLTTFTAEGSQQNRVLVKDISETGIGFFSKENWHRSQLVRLNLPIQGGTLPLAAKIVRKVFDEKYDRYLYGCRLTEPNKYLPHYISKKQQQKQQAHMNSGKGKVDFSELTIE